jgi:excinuclease ABC subunit C
MKPVVVTPRAYADVRRLENWLIDKDANAATRVGSLLFEAMMSLSEFPERGVQALRSKGRELFVPFGANGYVIRYRVEATRVLIATVPTASKIAEPARLAYMSGVNDTTTDISPANALKGAALIKDEVSRLPDAPGVYRMIGENEEVLYVGKAKSLKKRVVQYAQGRFHTNRIAHMVDATRSMEFVTTRTEADALLLEINLIKQLKPRFNVLLRDDKSFPEIVIRRDHDAPQLRKHRGAHTIKGDYFGPFASAWAVNRTLNTLQKAFLLRSCSDSVYETRSRPCMLHQIKRCAAPCTGLIGKDDYQALVDQAEAFLRGKSRAVMALMAQQMEAASEDLEFERAARLRDRIRALASVAQESQINPETVDEADVVALHVEGGQACVQVFFFRAGQNWGNRAYFPRVTGNAEERTRRPPRSSGS